jgi:hypothetical protein
VALTVGRSVKKNVFGDGAAVEDLAVGRTVESERITCDQTGADTLVASFTRNGWRCFIDLDRLQVCNLCLQTILLPISPTAHSLMLDYPVYTALHVCDSKTGDKPKQHY